jgi:hypothetical protein
MEEARGIPCSGKMATPNAINANHALKNLCGAREQEGEPEVNGGYWFPIGELLFSLGECLFRRVWDV